MLGFTGHLEMLPDGFSKSTYYGFTLKKGFLYGKTDDGIPIACSSDGCNGKYYLYMLTGKTWKQQEIEVKDLLSLTCKN